MEIENQITTRGDVQKRKLATAIFFVFTSVCLIELVGEILQWQWLILLTKPLLAPLLLIYYVLISPRINYWLLGAFSCVWISNILFSFGNLYIETGTWFFLGYRFLVFILVMRVYRIRNWLPVFVGSFPFLFIYLVLIMLSYQSGNLNYMNFLQGGLIALIGGIALSGYVLRGDTLATVLLISTIMFTGTQFIFVIASYYPNILIFRPLTMLMYCVGQYALLHFVLQSDGLANRIPLERLSIQNELDEKKTADS